MNNWWKGALLGAGVLGLSALTGGAASPLVGLLGGEGAAAGAGAAGAAGATGAGEAAAAGSAAAASAAPEAAAATQFVTAPVSSGLLGGGQLSGTLAGTDMAYGGTQALAEAPSVAPSMMQQAADYAKMGGKAASAYGTVQQGMGAGQQAPRPAPAPQPIFQGQAAPIAQGLLGAPQGNQFAQMLLAQRQRGMLG